MRVSGFSIARNAVAYGYPITEAISSILPVCDELLVNVGVTDDGTLELVRSIGDPRITVLEREWDMSLRVGGSLISVESNHTLSRCTGDWCFYIQADEVLHEKYLPVVREEMTRHFSNTDVEALQFRYRHFYGSYDYCQDNNRRWYTKESRIIRRRPDIVSWGDGMDFRHTDGSKLRHVRIPAEIYHYGWVRPPETMVRKTEAFRRLYHSDQDLPGEVPKNLYTDLGNLRRFEGTHPAVMLDRVAAYNWKFDARIDLQHPDWVRHILLFIQPVTKRMKRLWSKVKGGSHE
jgi:hypothetical protein